MVDNGNQPGIKVLKAARIFDPSKLLLLNIDARTDYDDALPGFKAVSNEEWTMYKHLVEKEISNGAPSESDVFVKAF